MRIELRAAVPADGAAIARLAHGSLPERWAPEAFRTELEAKGGLGLVAVSESGEIVGYALAAQIEREAEIRSLAVAPLHRRSGVARRLLDALLACQRARGVRDVLLEVRASNRAALGLYAGAGFERRGLRPGYYADGEGAIVMGVTL
jgi:ribosomal-protein-alanine N-acetyltransferase